MHTPAPSPQPPAPNSRNGLLFVISAPSGAGKTSICHEIRKAFPELRPSISYTTRPMRPGEQDGVDYHFVSRASFDKMVADGDFAEWAEVHGNRYGTARSTLLEALAEGADILLEIDYQGAEQLRHSGLPGIYIFILPPSMTSLRQRLKSRDTDDEAVIARRLANATAEIAASPAFDYLVVNDVLADAVDRVRAILLAESLRTQRMIGCLPREFGLK